MKADMIIKSNAIFNGIDEKLFQGGVAIAGNRFMGIYSEQDLDMLTDMHTKVYTYKDKLVTPGLHDSHIHMAVGSLVGDDTLCCNMWPVTTFDECMKKLQKFGELHPENQVIVGCNFNSLNLIDHMRPEAVDIDAYISDRPVVIITWDIHTLFTNSLAIKQIGITKNTKIPGIHHKENGEPNGVFDDSSAFIIQSYALNVSMERKKQSMRKLLHKLNQVGITSVSEVFPSGDGNPYAMWKQMEESNRLTARVTFYPQLIHYQKEQVEEYKENYHSGKVQFGGLKMLMDGVITPHTAWMHEPYADDPTTSGYPALDPDLVKENLFRAQKDGINVRIHTIGDRAVTFILDVLEEAQIRYGRIARRHCMEHVNYIKEKDIGRFRELGIAISTHPTALETYLNEANPMRKILGLDRLQYTWPVKSFLDHGTLVGTGTDYCCVPYDPMITIHSMVARTSQSGWPEGGWNPEQKITLLQALKMYTTGSAYVVNREAELGGIQPGMYADLAVFDKNLDTVSPSEYVGTEALLTIVDGKVVYQAE